MEIHHISIYSDSPSTTWGNEGLVGMLEAQNVLVVTSQHPGMREAFQIIIDIPLAKTNSQNP